MKRRNVLRRLGVAAGIGAGAVPSVTVEATPPGDDLDVSEVSFTEMEIEAVGLNDELPLVTTCRHIPRYVRPESTNQPDVYVGRYRNYDIQPRRDDSLVASYRSIVPASEGAMRIGAVPVSTSLFGSYTTVDGTVLPDIQLEDLDENRLQLSIGNQNFQIDPREGSDAEITVNVASGSGILGQSQVNLQIGVSRNHRTQFVGHPENVVVPNTPRWDRFVNHYRNEQSNRGRRQNNGAHSSTQRQESTSSGRELRIREHDRGYEIDTRGGSS